MNNKGKNNNKDKENDKKIKKGVGFIPLPDKPKNPKSPKESTNNS